jgi:hypothetical protein
MNRCSLWRASIVAALACSSACATTRIEIARDTESLAVGDYCFNCQRGRLRHVQIEQQDGQIARGQNLALTPQNFLLLQKDGGAPIAIERQQTVRIQIVDRRDAMARAAVWSGALGAVGAATATLAWGIAERRGACTSCPSAAAAYVGWPALALFTGGAGGTAVGSLLGLPFGRRYVFELQPGD